MFVLVTYDVSTVDKAGKRRLRKIAQACKDWGQRVQFSVFECEVNAAQWVQLRSQILALMNPAEDSVRFYLLDRLAKGRIEHHGNKEPLDLDGLLLV